MRDGSLEGTGTEEAGVEAATDGARRLVEIAQSQSQSQTNTNAHTRSQTEEGRMFSSLGVQPQLSGLPSHPRSMSDDSPRSSGANSFSGTAHQASAAAGCSAAFAGYLLASIFFLTFS